MALSEKLEGNPAQNQGSGAMKFDYKTKAIMSVLYIETPDGGYRSGTGVIVEVPTLPSPLLMTCNHIIPTKEIAKTSFVYFDRESEQKPGTAVEGENLFDFSTFKSSPEDKYDYTIIALNPDHMPKQTSGEERIRFPLNAYEDLGDSRLKVNDNVYLVHYPSMDGDCVLRESAYLVQFSTGYRFGHIAETQPGSSGCPVLKEYNKEWVLVGLHRSGLTFGEENVIVNSAIHVEAIHKDLLGMPNSLGDPDSDVILATKSGLVVPDGVPLSEPRPENGNVRREGQAKGDNMLSYRILKKIAESVGKRWKMLARELEVPEKYIEAIVEDNPRSLHEQSYQSLLKWKELKGEHATAKELKCALQQEGLNSLVHEYFGSAQ